MRESVCECVCVCMCAHKVGRVEKVRGKDREGDTLYMMKEIGAVAHLFSYGRSSQDTTAPLYSWKDSSEEPSFHELPFHIGISTKICLLAIYEGCSSRPS